MTLDSTRTRRLTLLDAMVLVASIMCALAINRVTGPRLLHVRLIFWPGDQVHYDSLRRLANVFQYTSQLLAPHLIMVGLATVALGLRRPRPTWQALCRQPGFAAALVATLIAAYLTCGQAVQHLLPISPFATWRPQIVMFALADRPGYGVAGAWITLLSTGTWTAARSWLDRLGTAIGAGWLACLVFAFLREYLFM